MLRVVRTETGLVQGLPAADPRITSFKGIPFAAPPTGDNRWRAPQPAQAWAGILPAHDFAPMSMQPPTVIDVANIYTREWSVDPDLPMDEDSLHLNVWTPAMRTDEKLPVFVWFFGGGLQVGHTAEMEFDGERIARRGVVVVTLNYRLNVFGFMCHPELTAEAPDAPANFGHLDQQAGMQWVRRNIAAFGGDPDHVTIGGQSAGGGSVMSQLTCLDNEGLFHRAIVESGAIMPVYDGNRMPGNWPALREAEREGVDFLAYLGVSTIAEARLLPAVEIRDKCMAYGRFWGTVIDGRFCQGNSFARFVHNQRLMVPVLWGNTSSEFFHGPVVDSLDALRQMARERFGEEAETYLSLIRADEGTLADVTARASVSSIEHALRVAVQKCGTDSGEVQLYRYVFDAEIPGWDNPGTFHSVDLWFFFETLAKCWRPFVGKHYDLARQMCNYWVHFIKNGNPNGPDSNGKDLPVWDPCTAEAPYGMYFGDDARFLREPPAELMRFLVDHARIGGS